MVLGSGKEVLEGDKVLWLIFRGQVRRSLKAVILIELPYLIGMDAG
jgi:hypothetical protein